jgi:hypothetical protein
LETEKRGITYLKASGNTIEDCLRLVESDYYTKYEKKKVLAKGQVLKARPLK